VKEYSVVSEAAAFVEEKGMKHYREKVVKKFFFAHDTNDFGRGLLGPEEFLGLMRSLHVEMAVQHLPSFLAVAAPLHPRGIVERRPSHTSEADLE